MKVNLTKIVWNIANGILLILAFCYFQYYIDPSLINFKQQPIFLFDNYFLYKYLAYPGGIAEYLAMFISQFFYSKLAGSLILTSIIFIAVYLSNRLLVYFFTKETAYFLQFIPGILLIHLHSHYEFDLRGDLMFVFALIFVLAYLKIFTRSMYIKLLVLLLSSSILFFFFGGTSLLLYTAIVVLSEIYHKNHYMFWLISVFQIFISILLLYIISIKSPYINFKMAYLGILCPGMYYKPLKFLYTLYIIIPILLLIRTVIQYTVEETLFPQHSDGSIRNKIRNVYILVIPFIIIGLLILDFNLSYSKTAKNSVKIHFYAANSDWESVLNISKELSTTDRSVLFQINRALYHLNKLSDEAFSYAQYWGENGLILTAHYSHDVLMFCSDLYFDMGHIKESLHWAYEAQTKSNQAPDVLKRIAVNNIILGEYDVAEKFLKILSKSILHKKWAMHYLSYLHNESLIEQDDLMNEKRKLLPKKDFFTNTQKPQYDLYNLFSENPGNRMAFEYFMVYSLFIHDLSTIAVNVKYLERLNNEKIPTHIEEALILFMTLNPGYPLDLGKYQISERSKKRFIGYSKILMAYKKDRVAAQFDLFQEFGNTYWYYIYYVSPLTTRRKIQEKTH